MVELFLFNEGRNSIFKRLSFKNKLKYFLYQFFAMSIPILFLLIYIILAPRFIEQDGFVLTRSGSLTIAIAALLALVSRHSYSNAIRNREFAFINKLESSLFKSIEESLIDKPIKLKVLGVDSSSMMLPSSTYLYTDQGIITVKDEMLGTQMKGVLDVGDDLEVFLKLRYNRTNDSSIHMLSQWEIVSFIKSKKA